MKRLISDQGMVDERLGEPGAGGGMRQHSPIALPVAVRMTGAC